ncbi:MAG: hypothetical protein PHQ34_05200, partial [Methanothrix sp.]|nr:hypothetical protein [Methanothrix sp.]
TGYYEFCGLDPGSYTVTETTKPGWTTITTPVLPVTLDCNTNLTNRNFTNQKLLCISGQELNSCTGDPLDGWTIEVFNKSTGQRVGWTTSNATGHWQICSLAPGDYLVNETVKSGWHNEHSSQTVSLVCENKSTMNFNNDPQMCLSGYKLNSSDNVGLAGWTIEVYNKSTGQKVGWNITNATGFWRVCNLDPGNYRVVEVNQPKWIPLPPYFYERPLECDNITDLDFTNLKVNASIKIKKYTNGEDADNPPGPYIWSGNPVTWRYNVTTSSNVPIHAVNVTDSVPGVNPKYVSGDVNGDGNLTSNEVWIYEAKGTATIGQYNNTGYVTGKTPLDDPVYDNNLSHYYGETGDIGIKKYTNGVDADTPPGPFIPVSANVTWQYNVTTTANVPIHAVNVTDSVPGVNPNYVSGDINQDGNLTFDEVWIYKANGTAIAGNYSNIGYVTGKTPSNETRTDDDPSNYYGESGVIRIKKYTNGVDADIPPYPNIPPGENVTWRYVVTTPSNVSLKNVTVNDSISGVNPNYVSGDINGDGILTKDEIWIYMANGTAIEGLYSNIGNVTAKTNTPENKTVTWEDPSHYFGGNTCNLTLIKTADKPVAHIGEDVTYTIDLFVPCDNYTICYTNVTLWDILPSGVELVSVYPEPSTSSSSNLTWNVGTLCSKEPFIVTLVVRVPIVDINYDMAQGVQGKGFVNVHNDYDTHQGPESITNCAYARADLTEVISSCASTRIVDPGTELKRREFGSGTYESEEITKIRTENKSIRSVTNLSAVHQPTSFALPQNRTIDYRTKWTEKSKGINTITGATMNEEYTSANKIEKDRSIELDRNGSTMNTEVEFEGTGHIGILKKETPDAHPKVNPVYEATEDYVGRFNVSEKVDEYGKNVKSEKSVSGYGYVGVDKRVRDSQRTYESGTGSYKSEELIDTPTNYIAKDISLVHGPTNYSYTPTFGVSQDMKWTEGMWSKSGTLRGGDITAANKSTLLPVVKASCNNSAAPATYISERFSSLDYLTKETVASGLNEMKTNASFSGQADFEAKAANTNSAEGIDNEERYIGQYDISRKVRIGGVAKYDRPHITVTKEGNF